MAGVRILRGLWRTNTSIGEAKHMVGIGGNIVLADHKICKIKAH